ncbi:glycosyltransferase [Streptosporangium sp. NPDC048047]|uniref:glycosyltransferase n=1 Tax=Streptosporangium sp. NPDC048047 TaxID=3155748 RepID=UPI0034173C5F
MGVHVCEVIKALGHGGSEKLLAERLLATPPTGKRHTVVCTRVPTDELVRRLRAAGTEVVDLTAVPRPLRLLRLVRVVRDLRPDVVNNHSPLTASVLRVASRFWRPRPVLVSTVHNVRYRLPTLLADRATGWLDACTVAVSPQVARAVTSWGSRDLRVRVHGAGVERQRRNALEAETIRKEWDVPESAFLVVHVANLYPKKSHGTVVEAAAEVTGRDPRAVFLLAGTGPLHEQVVRMVARLGSDAVRFLGPVADAARLIAAADLLVLGSSHEGLPVVVMEAFAAGVPVVCTAVGGVPDLVDDGRNGLLVPPGDPHALAGGILAAMRPETHERLRRGARDSGDALDIGRAAEWFDRLYDEISSRARAGSRS